MTTKSATLVEDLLARDGWPFERVAESTWRSAFRGETATFSFFVKLTGRLITFEVAPFLQRSPSPGPPASEARLGWIERRAALSERLLRLNREMMMARFSIGADGEVVLAVDFPTENLDESELRDCLDALSYYADRHYASLRALAG